MNAVTVVAATFPALCCWCWCGGRCFGSVTLVMHDGAVVLPAFHARIVPTPLVAVAIAFTLALAPSCIWKPGVLGRWCGGRCFPSVRPDACLVVVGPFDEVAFAAGKDATVDAVFVLVAVRSTAIGLCRF